MQKSGGIRAGFQGLEGMVVPVKIKALADLRSSDYRWIAGIAAKKSPLPDFFIGAHATVSQFELITRDSAKYNTYYPQLKLIKP